MVPIICNSPRNHIIVTNTAKKLDSPKLRLSEQLYVSTDLKEPSILKPKSVAEQAAQSLFHPFHVDIYNLKRIKNIWHHVVNIE